LGGRLATGQLRKALPQLATREALGQALTMFRLSAALKAKGEQAEAAFRAWLNQSGVAFLYIEQSRLNVPDRLRGRMKRPDYLVGIPHAGMVAFDVKAKSVYDDMLIFDLEEVDKLTRFEGYFHLSVNFACLDLDRPGRFLWVPLLELMTQEPQRSGKRRVLAYPAAQALEVDLRRPFLEAMVLFGERSLCR
jgi:hypothetical protein